VNWSDPTIPDLGDEEAFGRDPILEETLRNLVRQEGIQTVVETGTWRGYTAKRFADFVPTVHTIEANEALRYQAVKNVEGKCVCHEGISFEVMRYLIPTIKKPALYYLDAHWERDWPLLAEIKTIARLDPGPALIVIHDCQVPDHPEFGFDSYGGQPLNLEYVLPALKLLKWKWLPVYNSEAEGHKRGVLFVVPV
jgi:hypothetical protein